MGAVVIWAFVIEQIMQIWDDATYATSFFIFLTVGSAIDTQLVSIIWDILCSSPGRNLRLG